MDLDDRLLLLPCLAISPACVGESLSREKKSIEERLKSANPWAAGTSRLVERQKWRKAVEVMSFHLLQKHSLRKILTTLSKCQINNLSLWEQLVHLLISYRSSSKMSLFFVLILC